MKHRQGPLVLVSPMIGVLTAVLAACRAPGPALAPAHVAAQRGQEAGTAPRSDSTLQLRERSPAAKRVAAERYQMLRCIQSGLPSFAIDRFGPDYDKSLLFPLERSDRAYALEWPSPRGDDYRVSCFQRKGGRTRLVYQVSLKRVAEGRPAEPPRVASLLEWLATLGFGVKGRVDTFAVRDLAAEREYVKYDFESVISTLYVSLLVADCSKGGYMAGDAYFVEDDPDTIERLKGGSYLVQLEPFYRKYGLPVAKAELRLLR